MVTKSRVKNESHFIAACTGTVELENWNEVMTGDMKCHAQWIFGSLM